MAKFIIECPSCGTLNPASTFIFAKKAIKCGNCSAELNVKEHKLASRKCPFCQNVFLYDQTKRRNICPACKKDISSGFSNLISFPCPDAQRCDADHQRCAARGGLYFSGQELCVQYRILLHAAFAEHDFYGKALADDRAYDQRAVP